ncbi:MAG TPA: hypothetical protein DGH68_04010 [Bacteroidetes bacterium]|jgi:hypothetical protein|nr:hypothetical protein [Bacteroidota bacterium]
MANDRAWDMIDIRNQMQGSMQPQFQKFQSGFIDPLRKRITDFQTNTIDPYTNKMWGMMNDPLQRGYDAATKGLMFGRQSDALAGAKASGIKNISKMSAGTGTGNAMRNVMELEKGSAKSLRGAAHDVELADAEAKRNDFWNATQGYQSAVGMGQTNTGQLADTGNLETQNRSQEQQYWDAMHNMSSDYSQLQAQKNQNSFWNQFKGGMAKGLSAGITGSMFKP